MSGLTTAEMSKITVAGTLEELNSTLELAARLSAIHIIDYNGDELGIGTPDSSADKISNRLAIMRSCMSTLGSSPSDEIIPKAKMQDSLKSTLSDSINIVTADIVRLEEINSNLENIHAEISTLKKLAPLGLDIELMSGYESLNTYVGSVANLAATATELKAATADIIIFANPNEGKTGTVAVFCEAESGDEISQILSRQGFEALQLPEETGSPKSLLKTLTGEIGGLQSEAENIELSLENWNAENGGLLVGGIEVLEREFDIKTAPVRVATSDHAFILEGWVLTDQARIVTAALSEVATYAEHTPFERPHGRGHHFDHESEVELPPIAFQNIESAKPYELLTDAVGRPKYGRIDPTTFMFITYPIFFGMMLGDIAYGIAIVAIAWWISAKFSRNELVQQASKLLIYIGFSTIIFGYLFGEFAGFEYLPHGECDISGIVGVAQCEAAG
ncbi:MAG: V-type ATPase 116kDa subunit family protein, partial [Candidatus Poseidoniaceae archaeon]|nr:V-type ATPase 116kDa subunit family protein [Candidatus Poseidoniaceae archaeon]